MTHNSKRIQQEATYWATKAQLEPLTSEEEAQLQNWLNADSRHQGAYIRANVIRVSVERVAALTGGAAPAPLSSVPWWARLPFRNLAPRIRLIAASIAVLTPTLGLVWFVYQAYGDRYVSDIGEFRRVALDDGSSMFLNTATKTVVRLSESAREVQLSQGEALFDVAKDPLRPFFVRTGNVTVKALGTAFAVRNLDGQIDVTVEEGVVELIHDGAPGRRMTKDQHAIVAKARPVAIQALSRRETERQLAWRTGRLEFDGQPLSEAVDEMNRHNRRQIVVADAHLAREPVVGVFRSIDPEAFATIAAAALDAAVTEDGSIIRIRPRAAQ